ncbi:MAG: J domain-containing protein [Candidatus Heimdallarchaeota archaeon]|nr:J domain-containing protein [Candidatus Heimdallarchaeota archaeon]
MRDYYRVLGVQRDISQKALKKHYYKLARKYHPDTAAEKDREKAERKFKEITEAYNMLSTADKRRQYNMGGFSGQVVYSNGFSGQSKKQIILEHLHRGMDFSISSLSYELQVESRNLIKILLKLISSLNLQARIEADQLIFT